MRHTNLTLITKIGTMIRLRWRVLNKKYPPPADIFIDYHKVIWLIFAPFRRQIDVI